MARKGKKETTFSVEQHVIRTNVVPHSFDVMLRFTNGATQPELFMDELVKLVLEGLIERFGTIVVKFNWWDQGLTVIAPDAILTPEQLHNALQGTQEGSGATIDSNPSPTITLEK